MSLKKTKEGHKVAHLCDSTYSKSTSLFTVHMAVHQHHCLTFGHDHVRIAVITNRNSSIDIFFSCRSTIHCVIRVRVACSCDITLQSAVAIGAHTTTNSKRLRWTASTNKLMNLPREDSLSPSASEICFCRSNPVNRIIAFKSGGSTVRAGDVCTMDVVAIYPSISIKDGVEAVLDNLGEHEEEIDFPGTRSNRFFLSFCKTTFSCSARTLKRQMKGVVMENHLAPPFAILFIVS